MSEPDIHQQLTDGIIVSAGFMKNGEVFIYTADKKDAEYLYNAVKPVSTERQVEKTGQHGIHREYYLELAASDEHSLSDEEAFEWNTRPIWRVCFKPTDYFLQRVLNWSEDGQVAKAPRDFSMTPTVAKLIYYIGAHENQGSNAPYIEFEARDFQKLDAELKTRDIESTNVGDLWVLDEENSARFRAYAGIPVPSAYLNEETEVDTDE